MSVLTKLANLGREIQGAADSVRGGIAALRKEMANKRKELDHARTAPLPPQEVKARIREWISRTGEHARRGDRLVQRFGHPDKMDAPWSWLTPMTWGEAAAFLGPQLTASLTAAVDAEYVAGPSSAARPAVIARLSAELAELEAAEEAAIDDANATGMQIAHRPEVIQRRQDEAYRLELAQKAERDRRAREVVVDARYPQRSVGPSSLERARSAWEKKLVDG